MSLGSEVHNSINFVFLEAVVDQIGTADVTLDKLEVGKVLKLAEVLKARAVVELVVDNNIVLRVFLTKEDGSMGCNETFEFHGFVMEND